MRFKIFLEDLNPDVISRIKWTLRYDLADEIDEAAAFGANRDVLENEMLDDYLNRHNCGFEVEL
jgi:hypothetical protein